MENRFKRSIVLDFTTAAASDTALEIISKAGIFVTNSSIWSSIATG
jgi:crotonobetainyl-CoA:carnitine CoA-transferase CaiB-like acyl-CoA transferase